MKPYELHRGNNIELLRRMADASVDSIVTDPPYELGFMGKAWDAKGIACSVELWRECLRVLKPGGHLLAFGGTRTFHRVACAIEDAGFDLRDTIMWVYGSGFPKSLDVSKAIDKAVGAERSVLAEGKAVKRMIPGSDQNRTGSWIQDNGREYVPTVTEPATDAARQWQGWGTSLKPAWEPIIVARKPLVGTVAENVLAHGTGAINVDGCRVDGEGNKTFNRVPGDRSREQYRTGSTDGPAVASGLGRWPANLIHDGSDEVLAAFPQAPGQMAKASASDTGRAGQNTYGAMARGSNGAEPRADSGSAARFFYCAKASRADRNEGLPSSDKPVVGAGATMRDLEDADWQARNGNFHPTVKPTALMRYLVRLVTPPGGTVLDVFNGSGSTGKAAILEGMRYIGLELDEDEDGKPIGYIDISEARLLWAMRRLKSADSAVKRVKPAANAPAPGKPGHTPDLFA